jgi:hypothetical protein
VLYPVKRIRYTLPLRYNVPWRSGEFQLQAALRDDSLVHLRNIHVSGNMPYTANSY